MRGSKGQSLPDGQVRVEATLPDMLSPASTLPITVSVQPGVPAGEYNGTLLIEVRDQPAGIEVPIVVKSKHALYWPLFTLAAGLAVASVLSWWNTDGQKKNTAREDLIALRATLSEAKQWPTIRSKPSSPALPKWHKPSTRAAKPMTSMRW